MADAARRGGARALEASVTAINQRFVANTNLVQRDELTFSEVPLKF
jgi:hypothetical protein